MRRILDGKGFVRLEVGSENDVTEVDFGADFRLLPAESGALGKVLAGEELAINKVLAVFGRAEARDFVDLASLEERYGLEQLCRRAMDKDPGFDPQIFRDMVRSFARLPRDEFEFSDERYEQLVRTVDRWQEILRDLTVDRLRGVQIVERGDDLGLGI